MFGYLASPFSHPDPAVREYRYNAVMKKTAELALAGEKVFSPIAHTFHLEALTGKQPHDFWMSLDIPLLIHASVLWVLILPGWQESKGVAEEIAVAKDLGIPVRLVSP